MKYRKERLFLRVLLPYYKNELLSYTFWNEREKKLVKLVYLDNKSILDFNSFPSKINL